MPLCPQLRLLRELARVSFFGARRAVEESDAASAPGAGGQPALGARVKKTLVTVQVLMGAPLLTAKMDAHQASSSPSAVLAAAEALLTENTARGGARARLPLQVRLARHREGGVL